MSLSLSKFSKIKMFNICHTEVFNTYSINIQWFVSQTQQNLIMFIIVLGQNVSILIESSSGLSKKIISNSKDLFS